MKVFLRRTATGNVFLQARVEGPGVLGDVAHEIHPGETFAGHSFQELLALGDGEHDLQDRFRPQQSSR